MAEHFSKTYKSPEDLVKLLMSRGLQVSNEAKAAAYIRNIGYFWMTNARYFASSSEYRETMKLIKKEYDRSREDFIKHFKQKYSEPYPPAWELVEILPLGVITRIYGNIRDFRIQKMIAKRFYLNIPVFESWMTILTLTRNSCCHHARVWNRECNKRTVPLSLCHNVYQEIL